MPAFSDARSEAESSSRQREDRSAARNQSHQLNDMAHASAAKSLTIENHAILGVPVLASTALLVSRLLVS